MAVAAVVDDINSIDEAVREHYVKDEASGKFRLDVTAVDGYVLENVDGLNKALKSERKLRGDFEKKTKEYEAKYKDVDLEEIEEIRTKYDELSKIDPTKESERLAQEKYEAQKKRLETTLTKQWETKIANEYEPSKKKAEVLEKQLKNVLVQSAALKAIAEEEGEVDLLLPHVIGKMKFEMNTDENKFETYLVGEDGEPMYNTKGQKMATREFVASLKTKFPAAFKSTVKPGGGTNPNKQGGKKEADPNNMTPVQMIQAGLNKK